ncbi:MAG: tetratricopeptide repeat protein [Elusimicrobia bacterium]|nr:tetratricopeptide repeat protein [Elusimicrobiota bacterium]MBD3412147.1 tetratricopeptide repeat protein [Elusimicrobiota bacterium]
MEKGVRPLFDMKAIYLFLLITAGCMTAGFNHAANLPESSLINKQKTVDSLKKAIEEYQQVLSIDPENIEALCSIAHAYITIIEIKTHALIVEKDEYKPILKDLGSIAVEYAKRAYTLDPRNPDAITAYLKAYGYYSSSMGIVTAVLKGAAGLYKKLARELIAVDDTYRDACGYLCLGRLYYSAPWPVGSKKKACDAFIMACKKSNQAVFPHYWLAKTYQALTDEKYVKEFEIVLSLKPSAYEAHFIDACIEEAKKQLDNPQ